MASKARLLVGAGLTYAVAVGVGYGYATFFADGGCKLPQSCRTPDDAHTPKEHRHTQADGNVYITDAERHAAFEKNATKYDDEIGKDEVFMGLNLLRWWLMRSAEGDVLEVGCGTGRNFPYYSTGKVKKVVAVDAVPGMLLQAMKKANKSSLDISFDVMNAHTLKFADASFDTVVDTFGLCSYDDPVAVLREMSRVCKPSGKILLIEHGRGSYDWINKTINRGAQQHACNWGCIWNRDIDALVAQAGLRVKSESRWHFGTTYLIEAAPAEDSKTTSAVSSAAVAASSPAVVVAEKGQ